MQPSSLIFVVIAGVWAAFLVQHWIRRREHIATARSVDAFSETLRVLKVRDHGPEVDLDGPPRKSYAVSPTKAVRPQVTVKRAETLLSRPLPETDPAHEWEPGESAGPAAYLLIPDRATRGLTFLTGLLGTVVFAVLSLTGVLVAWAPLVPLALALGGFLWVRQAALSARAARVPVGVRTRESARPTSVGAPAVEAVGEPAPVPGTARGGVFDVNAGSAGDGAASLPDTVAPMAAPLLDEDDMPLTWDPRPVPRPTYAMKATATWVPVEERAQEPVRPTRSRLTPVIADLDDDIPESFQVARRSAVG